LSSKIFYRDLNSFKFNIEGTYTNKEIKQFDTSLYKYFSRTHTKTSPLGYFNQISSGKLIDINDELFYYKKSNKIKIFAKINNFIFKHLCEIWFNDYTIYRHFKLKINNTKSINSNDLDFISSDGQFNKIQQLELNAIIIEIIKYLNNKKNVNYENIFRKLKSLTNGDADNNDIRNYLHNLIVCGFLEFDLGIDSNDFNWCGKMMRFFAKADASCFITETKLLKEIDDFLNVLPNIKEPYLLEDIIERTSMMLNSYFNSKSLSKGDVINSQGIFKVDVRSYNKYFINKNKIQDIIISLNTLINFCFRFNAHEKEKEILKKIILEKKTSAKKIKMLELFEDYLRFKEEKISYESEIEKKWSDFYNKANQYFINQVALATVNDNITIDLENEEFISLFSEIKKENRKGSFGCFIQFDKINEDETLSVVNSVFPGYGKLASRFLFMFNKQLTLEVLQDNLKLFENGEVIIENTDLNFFNANFHPKLTSKKISSISSLSSKQRDTISINNLFVQYQKEIDELMLIDKNGARNFTIDLGFEIEKSRTEMFQFLNLFQTSEWPNLNPIKTVINNAFFLKSKEYGKENNYKLIPRIYIGKSILLQRKGWLFKKTISLDFNFKDMTEFAINTKLFLKKYNLPSRFFISFPKTKINKDNLVYDYFKTIYIYTTFVLGLKLFKKYLQLTKDDLYIEEALPDPLSSLNNNENTSEFLIQWYSI
jgi:hypothetical protein